MLTPDNFRSIARCRRLAPERPGFAGPGHSAVEVIGPNDLTASDPFVLLMDDRIDFEPGTVIGGAHPHAGLETVTFMLEGRIEDRDEGVMRPGDVVWMTAGRGVIHNEDVKAGGRSRLLQLWITLPEKDRAAAPRFDVLRVEDMPVFRAPGVEARVYSGASNGLVSQTRNYVPVTLVDVRLSEGAVFEQALPAHYNGFVLPLSGAVRVGSVTVAANEIGWLDRRDGGEATTLAIEGSSAARVLLYAGQRQEEPTVQHGPFVAGSQAAIEKMFREFRAGRFTPISELAH